MSKAKTRKIILSREKWLEISIEALAKKSKSKFNLDALLNVMPVTKGSFYNHFKNRNDFLIALVDYWDRHDTRSVIDVLEALPRDMPAESKLWELMCVVHEMRFNQYELLMRSLALESPEISEAIKAIDQKRLSTVGSLFADMGFEGDELEMRTLAFVTTISQDANIYTNYSPESYKRQLKLRHEFFTRR